LALEARGVAGGYSLGDSVRGKWDALSVCFSESWQQQMTRSVLAFARVCASVSIYQAGFFNIVLVKSHHSAKSL